MSVSDDWPDDLRLRVRTILIEEFVEYGKTTDSFPAEFLSNLLLGVEGCFQELEKRSADESS